MRVRMLAIAAGPDWSADAGAVVDRPDAEAKALIKGGYAEAFVEKPKADPPANQSTDSGS